MIILPKLGQSGLSASLYVATHMYQIETFAQLNRPLIISDAFLAIVCKAT